MYKKYFQKSKVFLYPLLNIPKGQKFVPINTYLAWEDEINVNDMKFLCLYKQKENKIFLKFEEKYLLNNKLFDDYQKLDENMHLYIFDYSKYPNDWKALIKGKYSKFTNIFKKIITEFFDSSGNASNYIESYIYPSYYHDDIAEDLNVNIELLKTVWELCDKPNLEKETLKLKIVESTLLQKNNVSLSDNLKKEKNDNDNKISSNREKYDDNNIKLGSKQDL